MCHVIYTVSYIHLRPEQGCVCHVISYAVEIVGVSHVFH